MNDSKFKVGDRVKVVNSGYCLEKNGCPQSVYLHAGKVLSYRFTDHLKCYNYHIQFDTEVAGWDTWYVLEEALCFETPQQLYFIFKE